MIHIKQTILTLVALLALTTGAWGKSYQIQFTPSTANTWEKISCYFWDGDGNNNGQWPGQEMTKQDNVWVLTVENLNFEPTNIIFNNVVGGTNSQTNDLIFSLSDNQTAYISGNIDYGTFSIKEIIAINWNASTKTGTLSMPGSDVTLEPEYYDEAAFEAGSGTLTANTSVQATTDEPLVVVTGEAITISGGSLQYAIGTNDTNAPTEGWDKDMPTATDIATAGTVYLWYYIKGDDTHSDTEPQCITVTIGPAPTYAVTFADDTPEPDKWKAEPNEGVKKGDQVTVTYSGTKKVLGVKAEKAVKSITLSLTNPVVGQVIGSDGKNYDYPISTAGVTPIAKICYVDGNHGLAMAMADEGQMNWSSAKSACEGKTPIVNGATWRLASVDEWMQMIGAAGDAEILRTGFNGVGGSNLQVDCYWSYTDFEGNVENYNFATYMWVKSSPSTSTIFVRACLVF